MLLDTNCFVRLYQSPVRPFLGREFAGYKLMTLTAMTVEFARSKRLQKLYAWLAKDLEHDLRAEDAVLVLSEDEKIEVENVIEDHEPYANFLLRAHFERERPEVRRSLSRADLELLATGIYFGTTIATDEWPLKLVVDDLASAPEDGYSLNSMTSLHVLRVFEDAGVLSPEQRRETVKAWLRYAEQLKRDWRTTYRSLFHENAPTL
jgi:hypothetical protein